jgi:zinc transport system substrate-binding protein
MKRAISHPIIYATLSIFLMLSAACAPSHSKGARPIIAVSIPPFASLVNEIAGDSVDIVTLLQSQANPEAFEPTVSDMKQVYNADLYLSTGYLPFEQSLLSRISANSGIKIVDASIGISPIFGTHSHSETADADDADPHTWTSISSLRIYADNICNALADIDPDNAQYYKANLRQLKARFDSLDNSYKQALAPYSGAAFLVWHPSLSYFARDYGLKQIAIGLENKEASALDMKQMILTADNADIRAFFIQANFDSRQAENISRQVATPVTTINPLDSDWERQFTTIVNAITH